MQYLVVYDIELQTTRYRVAKCLLNFGERVQKSVFECRLRRSQYAEMAAQLSLLRLEPNDSIRIYSFDADNGKLARVIGRETARPEKAWYVVG